MTRSYPLSQPLLRQLSKSSINYLINNPMNKLFEYIGNMITSMSAVILVLVLTILGLLTFTHTLFNEVLPITMTGWERELASWLLALGWEFTLLITTCNTQH